MYNNIKFLKPRRGYYGSIHFSSRDYKKNKISRNVDTNRVC